MTLQGASSGTVIIDCSAVTGTACLQATGRTSITISGVTLRGGGNHHRDVRALVSNAPGITLVDPLSAQLSDVALEGFASATGAGLTITCSAAGTCTTMIIKDSYFDSNTATGYGGGVFISQQVATSIVLAADGFYDHRLHPVCRRYNFHWLHLFRQYRFSVGT